MAVTYKSSLETIKAQCDHCGRTSQVAHVEGDTERTSWLLCAPCAKPGHPDAVIQAALEARYAHEAAAHLAAKAAQESEAAKPYVPPPTPPYSRSYAASVVDRYWVQEEIDDRQADRLCAAIWAGRYDIPEHFHRALRDAFVRHAARMHKDLGPRDPTRKHRSGLRSMDLCRDADGLRILIATMVGQGHWWQFDWQSRDWARRIYLLKRRYVWLTGQEWTPYTIARLETA